MKFFLSCLVTCFSVPITMTFIQKHCEWLQESPNSCFFPFVCVFYRDVRMCTCMHTCRSQSLSFSTIAQGGPLYWNPELISSAGTLSIFWGSLITASPVLGLRVGNYALLVFMWLLEIQTLVPMLAQGTLYSLGLLSCPSTSYFGSDSCYCKSSHFLFSCWVIFH